MTIPEPQSDSPTWPVVLAFAKAMEWKLSLNRHKGDREGWHMETGPDGQPMDVYLSARLREEVGELQEALFLGTSEGKSSILGEAADVANLAMMLADRAHNLLIPEFDFEAGRWVSVQELMKRITDLDRAAG
ncbi:MAG: hypothetical protein KGL39_48080 [Patescibacteria group bacterium]|nr:hypothetical protein [Patescibacteria group bacterium]